jgi:hypothetical protein
LSQVDDANFCASGIPLGEAVARPDQQRENGTPAAHSGVTTQLLERGPRVSATLATDTVLIAGALERGSAHLAGAAEKDLRLIAGNAVDDHDVDGRACRTFTAGKSRAGAQRFPRRSASTLDLTGLMFRGAEQPCSVVSNLHAI